MKFRSFIFFTLLNFNILFSQYVELSRLGVLDFEPRGVPISLTQRFTEAVRNELENTNLIQVIDRRKGLPITLGIIYIHAARAQGWDIDGLNFPGHFLLRIEDGVKRTIFDPFNGGKTIEISDMRALIKKTLGNNAELSAKHYRAASNREILIRLQNNKKIRLLKSRKITEALTVVESMLEFSPSSPEIWYDAGILHKYLGNLQAAIIAFNHCYDVSTSINRKNQVMQIINELHRNLF